MRKLILSVIFFLLFTASANAAWLSGGWDQRIEITLSDYAGDIGASVTWLPVTVFLTSTQCEEVFVELTTDAEYLKVAFTKADGTTQLYGEKELYDVSEQKGIFHVSRDGWVINANTTIYLYYDKDHADNSTYIGAIDTTPGHAVWDSNFKFVCHMVDATTSTAKDSTSNGNDGTKTGANEPIEATGKVGKGQDFDGSNDKILIPKLTTSPTELTMEGIFKADNTNECRVLVHNNQEPYACVHLNQGGTANKIYFSTQSGSVETTTYTVTNYRYIVGTVKENDYLKLYVDDNYIGSDSQGAFTYLDDAVNNYIGCSRAASLFFPGIADEVRLSQTVRSAAWVKATYNTLWDTLLTYGGEETPVTFIPQIIMF